MQLIHHLIVHAPRALFVPLQSRSFAEIGIETVEAHLGFGNFILQVQQLVVLQGFELAIDGRGLVRGKGRGVGGEFRDEQIVASFGGKIARRVGRGLGGARGRGGCVRGDGWRAGHVRVL